MMIEKIISILSMQLDITESEISLDSNLSDLDCSVYDIVDIVMSLEDEFGIEVPEEVSDTFETVQDIVNFIEDNI